MIYIVGTFLFIILLMIGKINSQYTKIQELKAELADELERKSENREINHLKYDKSVLEKELTHQISKAADLQKRESELRRELDIVRGMIMPPIMLSTPRTGLPIPPHSTGILMPSTTGIMSTHPLSLHGLDLHPVSSEKTETPKEKVDTSLVDWIEGA